MEAWPAKVVALNPSLIICTQQINGWEISIPRIYGDALANGSRAWRVPFLKA